MLNSKSLIALFSCLCLCTISFAIPKDVRDQRSVKINVSKGKIPQGVIIKKNKVVIKEGFFVTKVSDSEAKIARMNNDETTGSFSCGCSAGGGGCKVVIEGNSVTCVEAGACTKGICTMTVTIPSMGMTVQ